MIFYHNNLVEHEEDYGAMDRFTEMLAASFAEPLMQIFGLVNCIRHGDFLGTRDAWFLIPQCAAWPMGAILGVLRQAGIDVYDIGVTMERCHVIVDRNDYWRVIEAFDTAGVPYQAEDISRWNQ